MAGEERADEEAKVPDDLFLVPPLHRYSAFRAAKLLLWSTDG
ncbi:hypothetical protein SNOG_03203 [Parastagonospora nodorum SN15]|uniref:Uncharacterized protein n=1 Tax=Phaeosphaeria nodorum (strain SN15 / ATCC MYA-4574 / FGSC 10173) TaxID=321614 RepID=Q0UYG1_PHANO|nr:hypothetical protein SNOG_03203 [Parastagonospora nodorum SN15]EAT89934.1 hypothetical protein SNOG_03203 [Parastagonospora nodorum SN15]